MSEEINENNINEEEKIAENKEEQQQPEKDNLKLLKIAVIFSAVFFAVFAAVYTIIDKNTNNLGTIPFEVMGRQIEKIFDDEVKFIEKNSPAPVKIETKENKYIVTISLKSFDNNPENIKIETSENGIKINGTFKKQNKENSNEHSFYQNVIFPEEINKDKIEKITKKDKIIIILPFEKND